MSLKSSLLNLGLHLCTLICMLYVIGIMLLVYLLLVHVYHRLLRDMMCQCLWHRFTTANCLSLMATYDFTTTSSYLCCLILLRKVDLDLSTICIVDVPWRFLTIFFLLEFKSWSWKMPIEGNLALHYMGKQIFKQMCKQFSRLLHKVKSLFFHL